MASDGSAAKKARTEYFPGINKATYKGDKCADPLAFKYYNKDEVLLGKPMKEWCRFAVCWWHTFNGGMGRDPFSFDKTHLRPWDKDDSLDTFIERVHVAFEFFTKLGVEYYCFHDCDVAPQGNSLEEFQKNLDVVTDLMLQKQKETGIKLLWGTQNCFSNIRYKDGASTSPDVDVFSYACAQTKKMLEISKKLGGECHVFWGGREGFATPLNTDVRRELDHMAAFLKMSVDYKNKIGHGACQMLIEPKPREPSTHPYDYDAQTVIGFLKTYGLDKDFKINIEPNHTTLAGHDYEHDIRMAAAFNMLGSIDCNAGQPYLGWDTDEFPSDPRKAMLCMLLVVNNGGIAPGGNNFDAKLRRESTDLEDMFVSHIGGMDCLARGLRAAVKAKESGELDNFIKNRYKSFDGDFGKKIEAGTCTLEEAAAHAMTCSEPKQISGKQEYLEQLLNTYF
jgi:xylose isomerase